MIEIIGITVGGIIAIGVAIYQVKNSKQRVGEKRKLESHDNIWSSLNVMRSYFDLGMQTELNSTGTIKLEPIFYFRNSINEAKSNIEENLYNDLNKFYEYLAQKTNSDLFEPMKLFFEKKDELPSDELKRIEFQVNESRLKIVNDIENFMANNKNILS